MKPRGSSIAILTHYGRKTGEAFRVPIWWVELDGQVWIGSLNSTRSWVRNVKATGRALLDRGRGDEPIRCEWVSDPASLERFGGAIKSKYWILGRLLPLLYESSRCAFRTSPAKSAA